MNFFTAEHAEFAETKKFRVQNSSFNLSGLSDLGG